MFWCARFSLMALIALSLWLQLIEAFCIYNHLDDPKAYIDIYDLYQTTKSFKQVVSPGGKECCPYANSDCSNGNLDPKALKTFNFRIRFDGGPDWQDIKYRLVGCEAGGGLNFFGTATHHYVKCVYSDGTTRDAPIVD